MVFFRFGGKFVTFVVYLCFKWSETSKISYFCYLLTYGGHQLLLHTTSEVPPDSHIKVRTSTNVFSASKLESLELAWWLLGFCVRVGLVVTVEVDLLTEIDEAKPRFTLLRNDPNSSFGVGRSKLQWIDGAQTNLDVNNWRAVAQDHLVWSRVLQQEKDVVVE